MMRRLVLWSNLNSCTALFLTIYTIIGILLVCINQFYVQDFVEKIGKPIDPKGDIFKPLLSKTNSFFGFFYAITNELGIFNKSEIIILLSLETTSKIILVFEGFYILAVITMAKQNKKDVRTGIKPLLAEKVSKSVQLVIAAVVMNIICIILKFAITFAIYAKQNKTKEIG